MDFNLLNGSIERWAALRTAARWEKKIASSLFAIGVPVFVPIITRVTKYKSKTQSTEVPMFGGYVFCSESHFTGNELIPRDTRKQIAQILRPPDYGLLKKELERITEVTSSRRLIQEKVYGQVGRRVVIVAGSFVGSEGTILQLKPNQRRLVLEISFLGVKMDVEMDETIVVKSQE